MSANENRWVEWAGESPSPLLNESLRAGLVVLWRAYIGAQYTGASAWDFAQRISRLHEAGMTSSDLRWLVAKGFAEHGQETTGDRDSRRSFRESNGYFFNDHSCLILTGSGAALAEDVFRGRVRSPQETPSALAVVASETAGLETASPAAYEIERPETFARKPRWHAIRRELSFAGRIVKRFRVPARNQETILSVFEEEGWAEHIHDPLPVNHLVDAPTRLHDAINRLNRCQINPLIRFHGDGKGTGVFWELNQKESLD
ncbi:MAG TPA: hypothetical protein VFX97_12180 [Pyrinomonadaceae bacterium]|nr:hypothetical protein [Pyrinomonadaceae bacterium]